ncbi:phosphoglycolate phosphatase [Allopseudospirillum japonicum]|uniref:Phosphoglycolate phosphatase n=1 Tax=Allopseudospirillum japonicum TaxID=64971 RepID=A0A1H6TDU4_9GAMM|nr:HAD-IA family hydrolase [Allopseudospirillum japonicum]SEI74460.1 phosphoglycolate phosphatase [Allopseudospirillum japonicum]
MNQPVRPLTELPLQAVLFDLDGTLLDTAADLHQALNQMRQADGLPPLPYDQVRAQVSNGASALIELGYGVPVEAATHAALRQRLLDTYAQCVAQEASYFAGMETLLQALEEAQISWGIVTNKPRYFTERLLHALNIKSAVTVCPEDIDARKPDPAPLWFACRQLAIEPQYCVYVGDHQRDIEAGRRAGMRTLVAAYGYLGPQDLPHQWQADHIVHSVPALHAWLRERLPDAL